MKFFGHGCSVRGRALGWLVAGREKDLAEIWERRKPAERMSWTPEVRRRQHVRGAVPPTRVTPGGVRLGGAVNRHPASFGGRSCFAEADLGTAAPEFDQFPSGA